MPDKRLRSASLRPAAGSSSKGGGLGRKRTREFYEPLLSWPEAHDRPIPSRAETSPLQSSHCQRRRTNRVARSDSNRINDAQAVW